MHNPLAGKQVWAELQGPTCRALSVQLHMAVPCGLQGTSLFPVWCMPSIAGSRRSGFGFIKEAGRIFQLSQQCPWGGNGTEAALQCWCSQSWESRHWHVLREVSWGFYQFFLVCV